ncbi:MAG: M28 family peptidase [Saprospiraceae bacterium]|nr:M28 family peptidase [Saprospiraceae bacterium]
MKLSNIFLVTCLVTFFFACKNDKETSPSDNTSTNNGADSTNVTTNAPTVKAPEFDADAAKLLVKKQVDFGPRVPNTAAHQACRKWMVQQLKSYGCTVIEQNFTAKSYNGIDLKGTNIIASINPQASNRIMLAAHWDSRHIADKDGDATKTKLPILGADDGGSGVAVLMQLAKTIQNNPIKLGIDFILFDAEDHGDDQGSSQDSWCLGSQYWAKNPHQQGYRPMYGILLDMVGGVGSKFPVEGFSANYAPQVVSKVWGAAMSLGYGDTFLMQRAGTITDDHYYVNTIAGIPMADIIALPPGTPYGFPSHWHTHNDNMSAIDAKTLKIVGATLLQVIYQDDHAMNSTAPLN